MMKKIRILFTALLLLLCAFLISGCSGSKNNTSNPTSALSGAEIESENPDDWDTDFEDSLQTGSAKVTSKKSNATVSSTASKGQTTVSKAQTTSSKASVTSSKTQTTSSKTQSAATPASGTQSAYSAIELPNDIW